jgi:hypothetical protein
MKRFCALGLVVVLSTLASLLASVAGPRTAGKPRQVGKDARRVLQLR